MKKKEKFNLLLFVVMMVLGFGITSCEKDEEESDPPGTIELDMRKRGEGETRLSVGGGTVRINYSDNFESYRSSVRLVDVGSVSGLSSIKDVPLSGWTSEVGVRPGHGYILYDKNSKGEYMRQYVVNYIKAAGSGGVIGAAVKYQYPWYPN